LPNVNDETLFLKPESIATLILKSTAPYTFF